MFTLDHCPTSRDTVSCPHVRTVPVTTSKQRRKGPYGMGLGGEGGLKELTGGFPKVRTSEFEDCKNESSYSW